MACTASRFAYRWLARNGVKPVAASIDSRQPAAAATHRLAEDKLGRRILVSLLTVIFYYYPSILTTTLSLFTCYRLDTPATFNRYPGNARVSHVLEGEKEKTAPFGVNLMRSQVLAMFSTVLYSCSTDWRYTTQYASFIAFSGRLPQHP